MATGHTDMRKGFASLSLQVQELLRRNPLSGHLFCFLGRRGDLLKVIWQDGQGACLFTKKLERGPFVWPSLADRRGVDLAGADELPFVRHRLAQSSIGLASDERGPRVCLEFGGECDSIW
ncbi:IS66 family insertion sequence element accessory protein TnpB [Bradyrhizobium sp. WSM471]|uniref:IS66 family insertion sequence element accessory protein TnpB n=1 Tax=Bradyrhizobium sp. WSM471 TaxID=319017 RepID=UPI0002F012F9